MLPCRWHSQYLTTKVKNPGFPVTSNFVVRKLESFDGENLDPNFSQICSKHHRIPVCQVFLRHPQWPEWGTQITKGKVVGAKPVWFQYDRQIGWFFFPKVRGENKLIFQTDNLRRLYRLSLDQRSPPRPRIPVANKGFFGDSLLKMSCHPGGDSG